METIFLYILAALSAVYLASLFFKRGIFQSIAKACLMPLVLAIYISGSDSIFIPVVLALFFGWLGDIFLLKIEDARFFKLGLAVFLLGHLFYIPTLLFFSGGINVKVLLISLPAGAALGVFLHYLIRPSSEMNILTIIYEAILLLMVLSAVQLFAAKGSPYGALALAGGLCFIASDTVLAIFTFRTKPRYGDFLVMLTYISAQLLIILGLSGV